MIEIGPNLGDVIALTVITVTIAGTYIATRYIARPKHHSTEALTAEVRKAVQDALRPSANHIPPREPTRMVK